MGGKWYEWTDAWSADATGDAGAADSEWYGKCAGDDARYRSWFKRTFEDYYDYANVCLNNGITNPEQIPGSGTLTFEAGSSKLEVAQKIKWQ